MSTMQVPIACVACRVPLGRVSPSFECARTTQLASSAMISSSESQCPRNVYDGVSTKQSTHGSLFVLSVEADVQMRKRRPLDI